MDSARVSVPPRRPAAVATWLLIAFAILVLAGLGVPIIEAFRAGDLGEVAMSFAVVSWFAGPAAVAAWLAARSQTRGAAWAFVGAEAGVVASTVGCGLVLVFARHDHANSEYGVGLILLPAVQFAAVLAFILGVLVITRVVGRETPRSPPDPKPPIR